MVQAPAAWRALRGDRVAMVFQEPMTALEPGVTVGARSRGAGAAQGRELEGRRGAGGGMLEAVGIN